MAKNRLIIMKFLYHMLTFCWLLVIFLLLANIISYLVLNYITENYPFIAGFTFSTSTIITFLAYKIFIKNR